MRDTWSYDVYFNLIDSDDRRYCNLRNYSKSRKYDTFTDFEADDQMKD